MLYTHTMGEMIKHEGVVVSVNGTEAKVRILQAGSCHGCQAKGMCGAAESKEKEVDAYMAEPVAIGETVTVSVSQRMGWKAVLLAYVVPFVILIGGVWLYGHWMDEAAAGTMAILSVGVWYLVLRLMRDRLQKEFSFTINKISK